MPTAEKQLHEQAGQDAGGSDEDKFKMREEREPEEEEEIVLVGPPVPPDGGWGWVIMFASFMVNVIVDGVCFSFGIFLLAFLDHFQESRGKTAWVGSVLNGMYLSIGPLVSALANKFGCRPVAIVGGVVASLAYILSIFSPNVDVLIVTYGAMGGFGFGLMYLPAIVMVGHYFEKKRAFATGVAVCGAGIGGFVFAPLSEKLMDIYGWKGATLIIAGVALNGVVIGALFRPLEPTKTRIKKVCSNSSHASDKAKAGVNGDIHNCEEKGNVPVAKKSKDLSPGALLQAKIKHDVDQSLLHEDAEERNGKQYTMQSMQNLAVPDNNLTCRSFCRSADDILLVQQKELDDRERLKAEEVSYTPLFRKDIFYSGSLMHIPQYQTQSQEGYRHSVTSIPREGSNLKPSDCCGRFQSLLAPMKNMMDFSLLLDPVFAIYGTSCFLCMAGFFVPFIFLPSHALNMGSSRDKAAFLVSIISITNTVARVVIGWVSDRPWADCLLINNCALVMGGVATILCPFCYNYVLLALYSCVFGVSIAVFVSLRSIIMVELLGLEKLTNAFGLVTMCQGLSSFIGAPIAGSLYDTTGNYNASFYVAGASLALAGIICFPLRRVAAWQRARRETRDRGYLQNGQHVALVGLKSSNGGGAV